MNKEYKTAWDLADDEPTLYQQAINRRRDRDHIRKLEIVVEAASKWDEWCTAKGCMVAVLDPEDKLHIAIEEFHAV